MKIIKYLTLFLVISFTTGCSKDEIVTEKVKTNLKNRITVNQTTTLISELLYNNGIEKINLTSEADLTYYYFEGKRQFEHLNLIVNGKPLNFYDSKYILEDDFLYNENKKDLKITIVENEPYVESNNYSGYLKYNQKLINDESVITLLVVMNELILDDKSKIPSNDDVSNFKLDPPAIERPCSFWNTYYSVGMGLNSSAAWGNYYYNNQNDTNSGDLIGCEPMGDPEYTNLGVVHYVTRAYCCNN